MSKQKMVYVPRNWKVSYVDLNGNEHKDTELRVNAEYAIVSNGETYNVSVSGIKTEENKNYIVAKVLLNAGTKYVIKDAEKLLIDLDTVTDIIPIISKYVKSTNSNRNKDVDEEKSFTFAFDTEKYSSKYRITVNAGEFVSLAVKDINDPNKKSRSYYGHITDVDSDNGKIAFTRYISNHGVRDIRKISLPISALLGVYRYELAIEVKESIEKIDEVATESVETTVEE